MSDLGSDTMRAVMWEGKVREVAVRTVPKPKLRAANDAIVRVTSAGICGSDLHTYRGYFGSANPPWQIGHEAVGIVVEIGGAVTTRKVGDRVIVSFDPDNGHVELKPPTLEDTDIYGFGPDFGDLGGCQAEYIRVPEADGTLIPIPYYPSHEYDYLCAADIFGTGWLALDLADFQPGDSVAIFGAGPVGLQCAHSAFLRGASKVYVVDHNQTRLDKAKSIGAIPINFAHSDPTVQIMKLEPDGVNRSCDCVGQECLNIDLKPQQNTVIRWATRVTAAGGGIGVIGLYLAQPSAPGRPLGSDIAPTIEFPMTEFWSKLLSIKSGFVQPLELAPKLLALIMSGRARPGFVVSSVIGIEEAAEAYRAFDEGKETKVVIKFPWQDEVEGAANGLREL
ncbi:hypothetical protein BDV95DRAFT_604744 [Massariosphaeria phaeospora]|uniref:Uncharacterized protein n=1 Tax=Massariosphaeria phaeospora TaxID=100035 RepID=A0A7C8MCX5_9PLEO|nr:hypothetical protein BDV95DRAFT_604744 [Massariosphaeria phaeospora]